MATYIALLRGINVGGKNRLPMKALRDALEKMGLGHVRTYIQSGNVVFDTAQTNKAKLEAMIQQAIQEGFGFSPAVQVLSQQRFEAAIAQNPYADRDVEPKCVHFFFLSAQPSEQALETAQALAADTEECALRDHVFYLFAPKGIGRSKLAAGAEKALGVSATARNLRSVIKILELAK